jgi:threonyl-tRNA synthetase
MQKIPYMLIVGEQEQQARKVAIRSRVAGDQGQVEITECVRRLAQEAASRASAPATA